jgi:Ecdysteroid kinase-like family
MRESFKLLQCSNMDGEVPAYFDAAFFEKVLRKSTDSRDVVVRGVNLRIATAPGDNYTSEIYRARIEFTMDGESRHLSLIIKNMPNIEMLDNLQVYEREVEMYCHTLPALSKLLDNEMFNAKCWHAGTDPCKMMILQDLKDLDYALANRKIGLDLAHSRLVLQKIGQFHAASIVLAERQPESMELYKFGILNPERENRFYEHFFNESLKSLAKVVAQWPGYDTIAMKLEAMEPNFMKRIYEHVKTEDDTIHVLNHGDLWTNNIMFQYEGAEPKEAIFVSYIRIGNNQI